MTAAEVRTGLDGKTYPGARLSLQERGRVIRLAHLLVHDQHLSIRSAQKVMAETYGIRRSTGTIVRDLADYVCHSCGGQ